MKSLTLKIGHLNLLPDSGIWCKNIIFFLYFHLNRWNTPISGSWGIVHTGITVLSDTEVEISIGMSLEWWLTNSSLLFGDIWFCFFEFTLSIVDLQWFFSFRCTAEWFSYKYTYIHSLSDSFSYRLLWNIDYSSLCYIVGPYWLSILYTVVCVLIPSS